MGDAYTSRLHVRVTALRAAGARWWWEDTKQIQEWLGHHSPAYTLREYVHLIDAGVGEAAFLDEVTAT